MQFWNKKINNFYFYLDFFRSNVWLSKWSESMKANVIEETNSTFIQNTATDYIENSNSTFVQKTKTDFYLGVYGALGLSQVRLSISNVLLMFGEPNLKENIFKSL